MPVSAVPASHACARSQVAKFADVLKAPMQVKLFDKDKLGRDERLGELSQDLQAQIRM